MIACVLCGVEVQDGSALCAHHLCGVGENWAASNRIMCDLVHRGIVPPRLSVDEREEAA
jgi:hypothetical protein